jgi:ABC-2 family transporter
MMYLVLEWQRAMRKRRALILNVLVPLALVAALPAGNAPAVHAAVVCSVLFAFFGTFGSAIPLVRDAETGRLSSLLYAGAHPRDLLVQRLLGNALLDTLQLAPSALVLALAYSGSALPVLLLCLFAALISANVLGTWIAVITRSIGEAALLGSVSALVLLHLGGAFRTPLPGTWQSAIAPFSPFFYLHRAVLSAFGAAPSAGISTLIPGAFITALAGLASVAAAASSIANLFTGGRR